MAEYRYLPLTGGIALTTVYALTCYTVIVVTNAHAHSKQAKAQITLQQFPRDVANLLATNA